MFDKNTKHEICSYEKYGFCMKREQCPNFHPTEKCQDVNCCIVNCRKRHPQQCRFFATQKGCRFGSACKFDHQKPMYFQTELDELKSNQEKMRTELHELKSNQKNMTQQMKIQDEKVKLLKERISSLEKNLLDFVNNTLVPNDQEEKREN